MVHIYRLIIALALFCFSFYAGAVTGTTEYRAYRGSGDNSSWASSRLAAANAWCSWGKANGQFADWVVCKGDENGFRTNSYDNQSSFGGVNDLGFESRLSCPANSSLSDGQCVCKSGYDDKGSSCVKSNPCQSGQHEEGGACVPDNCQPNETRVNGLCVKDPDCPQGQVRVNGVCKQDEKCPVGKDYGVYESPGEDTVIYLCSSALNEGVDGCVIRVRQSFSVGFSNAAGVMEFGYSGVGKGTGGRCVGGSSSKGPTQSGGDNKGSGDNNTNGGGTGGGSGSGTGGNGGDSSGNVGGTGSGSGGSSGGGTSGNTGGGSGSHYTGSNTTGNNSSQSGISNPKIPGVTVPKPVEKDKDGNCPSDSVQVGNLCYINKPQNPNGDGKCPDGFIKTGVLCTPLVPNGGAGGTGSGNGNGSGNGDGDSFFGGSCMDGFACKGDAIQCSIAQEQYRRNCVMFNDPSDESKLYDANKDKTGDRTKDNPNNENVSLSGRIDTSDSLGGGSCIRDLNITVWGHMVNLPLSGVCPSLAMFGNLLVAVSMLLAARIVTRG